MVNIILKLLWVVVVGCLLVGCANPINAKTASNYYQQGLNAERNGDFLAARQAYSSAYINTKIGNLGDESSAYALYEWSRISGYLKIYDEAEEGFRKTLLLIDKVAPKANQLRPPVLSELARLLNNTNQHKKAVPIFKQAINALNNAKTGPSDPIGFAVFLEMYAQSLENIGNVEYLDILQKIQQIKIQHPNANS